MLKINKDLVLGKWKEIAGEVQKKVGGITQDDLLKVKGNATALVGLLQQKLGISKIDAEKKVMKILEQVQGRSEELKSKVKTTKKTALGVANKVIDKVKKKVKL
jgi:uncharacterized protein YjbJ (UPF0337 family)